MNNKLLFLYIIIMNIFTGMNASFYWLDKGNVQSTLRYVKSLEKKTLQLDGLTITEKILPFKPVQNMQVSAGGDLVTAQTAQAMRIFDQYKKNQQEAVKLLTLGNTSKKNVRNIVKTGSLKNKLMMPKISSGYQPVISKVAVKKVVAPVIKPLMPHGVNMLGGVVASAMLGHGMAKFKELQEIYL